MCSACPPASQPGLAEIDSEPRAVIQLPDQPRTVPPDGIVYYTILYHYYTILYYTMLYYTILYYTNYTILFVLVLLPVGIRLPFGQDLGGVPGVPPAAAGSVQAADSAPPSPHYVYIYIYIYIHTHILIMMMIIIVIIMIII